MEYKIVEIHSNWQQLNQSSWPCTTLLRNGMRCFMKITELQSDWLARKQKSWACKNQESAQMSPDPIPHIGWGLRTRLLWCYSSLQDLYASTSTPPFYTVSDLWIWPTSKNMKSDPCKYGTDINKASIKGLLSRVSGERACNIRRQWNPRCY